MVNTSTFYLVGNIGKRWMLNDNVDITARIGGGLAVDGELSVDYTF